MVDPRTGFPKGMVKALKGLRVRVPEDVPESQAELADEMFDRIVEVAKGNVEPSLAFATLQAASRVRDEIIGPIPAKVQVTAKTEAASRMIAARRRLAAITGDDDDEGEGENDAP